MTTASSISEGTSVRVAPDAFPNPIVDDQLASPGAEPATALLAGGCFWCTEAVYGELDGVLDVTPGYAGGSRETANYNAVSSGHTGHAEAIRITYDPARLTYGQLLKLFFSVAHDPTQRNRQGNDIGPQYRSAIFPTGAGQRRIAEAYVKQLDDAGAFNAAIATTIEPGVQFYEAETNHHGYAKRNPTQPYITAISTPKVRKLEKYFPGLLKRASTALPVISPAGYDISPLSEEEVLDLAKALTAEERRVLLEHGTEPAFCGLLLDNKARGTYACRLCGLPLFASKAKFESGSGWPSFYEPLDRAHIAYLDDRSHGMARTEIRCARCGGHLGHVFPDGPPPTRERYCLNSVSMEFIEAGQPLPRRTRTDRTNQGDAQMRGGSLAASASQ